MKLKNKFVSASTLLLAAFLVAGLGSCRKKAKINCDAVTEFPYTDSVTAARYANCATQIDSADAVLRSRELSERKKLICMDLDGTITQHKSPMSPEAKKTLDQLGKRYKIIMVGAGNAPRIWKQMGNYPIDIIANYGMQEAVIKGDSLKIIRDEKVKTDSAFFLTQCDNMRKKYGYTKYKGEPVEFHESGMVTFALLGTKADKQEKLDFDPDKSKRRAMYPEMCRIFNKYTVFIGGTTSFDIAEKRFNKYDAIMNYATEHGYAKDQILFVGDDFGDGGGDSHVRLGGLDYIQITDYRNFPKRMQFLLK